MIFDPTVAIELIVQTIRDLITNRSLLQRNQYVVTPGVAHQHSQHQCKNGQGSFNSTPSTPVNDSRHLGCDPDSENSDDEELAGEQQDFVVTTAETRIRHHSDSRQDISYNRSKP